MVDACRRAFCVVYCDKNLSCMKTVTYESPYNTKFASLFKYCIVLIRASDNRFSLESNGRTRIVKTEVCACRLLNYFARVCAY